MGMWGWEHEDWMSCLPDETLLSRISVPGTHDSMTYIRYQELNAGNANKSGDKSVTMDEILQKLGNNILGATAACQSKSLGEQLKMGARFFDLRLDHTMSFYHGITSLDLTSEDAMQPLTKFLNEHPDEVIFLRMKSENTSEEATYREAFERNVIARYRSYFWDWFEDYNGAGIKDEHGVVIPTLGEARGKIILFNSYQLEEMQPGGNKDYIGYQLQFYTPASAGEPFPFTCQHLQDKYNLGSKPEKLAAIKENAWAADKCTDSMYYINFISGVDFPPVPLLCATKNNPKVEKFLMEEIRNRTGIAPVDFMGEDENVTLWVLFINSRRHSLM